MARMARVVVPGLPHHVTQRGVRSLDIFHSDDDRKAYLQLMAEACEESGVEVWAWCLMPNHIHMMAVPKDSESLARAIGETHRRYTRRINFRDDVRGHLFQERFHSFVVQEDRHAVAVGRYIEMNPVEARLVRRAVRFSWSSAGYNAGERPTDVLVKERHLERLGGRWEKVLSRREAEIEDKVVELHGRTGRPLGSDAWVAGLERRTERRLRPLPVGWPKGRPRKKR